ncbi:MAG TPA: protease complex subunit PrcB family protein [Anaerolineae bacterium]|nr:protease complex subunit PrcB family protein [Anaerolineae bacterium]
MKPSTTEHRQAFRTILRCAFGLLLLLLSAGALAGCTPQPVELPFESVIQGSDPSRVRGSAGEERGLLIIGTAEEIADPGLGVQFDSEIAEQLRAFDYERRVVIIVFRGQIGGSYSQFRIDILGVTRTGDQVVVKTHFGQPGPNEATFPLATYPYHIIAVTKEGEWAREMRFVLEVDGQAVKERTHFVP